MSAIPMQLRRGGGARAASRPSRCKYIRSVSSTLASGLQAADEPSVQPRSAASPSARRRPINVVQAAITARCARHQRPARHPSQVRGGSGSSSGSGAWYPAIRVSRWHAPQPYLALLNVCRTCTEAATQARAALRRYRDALRQPADRRAEAAAPAAAGSSSSTQQAGQQQQRQQGEGQQEQEQQATLPRRLTVRLPLPSPGRGDDALHNYDQADWPGGIQQRFRRLRPLIEEQLLSGYDPQASVRGCCCGCLESLQLRNTWFELGSACILGCACNLAALFEHARATRSRHELSLRAALLKVTCHTPLAAVCGHA